MAYFSIPRSSCIGETLLDGSTSDSNDGTKVAYTLTNGSYANTQVGYQKQHAVFGATTSFTRASLASIQTLAVAVYPTAASKTLFTYVTTTGLVTFDGSYVVSTSGLTNATIYVNGVQASTLTANAWNLLIITHDAATATNFNLGSSSFLGNACMLRAFNAKLTEIERIQLWHEFNRKLGGGSDFGSYIPAPTAQFEADGSNTFMDVSAQGTVTRTAGAAASDDFGITRAISTPNQSWTSVSGDSFVYWNNSGWKLEKNATGVSATGINTANTVRAVLYFPAGVISTAQQTYLENCFKRNYPYAFRRSIPSSLSNGLVFRGGAFNGSTMYDESGNGYNFTGTATKVRAGQMDAGSFSSQRLTLTRTAAMENANGSLACWFKTSDRSNAAVMLGMNDVINANRYGVLLYRDPSGLVNLEIANASTYYRVTSSSAYDDGKWHRAVGKWDGSNIYLYVDGGLVASAAQGGAIAYNSLDFCFGGDITNGTRYFTGQLAYPTLWNRALNSYEVMMDRYSTYVQ